MSSANANVTTTPAERTWPLVARREITVKLHDRNFLISTGVVILLIVGSFAVQFLLIGRSSTKTIAVASPTATKIVNQASATADAAGSNVSFKTKVYPSEAAVRSAVSQGKQSSGLIATGKSWRLIGTSDRDALVTTYVAAAARQDVVDKNAAAAGTSLQALSKGADVRYDVLKPKGGDGEQKARIGGIAFGVLFYLASLLFGMAIANSVVEEKQNRVVEILAAAIPIRQLLIGKVFGNTVLAVAQVALLSAFAAIGFVATGNTSVLGDIAAGGLWFLAFFLVGFVTLACRWAVIGALATRAEDIQSGSTPMTLLVVAVFAIGTFATGSVAQIASYVPLLSTVAMPASVVRGDASWWQALASLLISVVVAYAVIRFAERMYRGALLQTGSRTSYRQALAGTGSSRSKD